MRVQNKTYEISTGSSELWEKMGELGKGDIMKNELIIAEFIDQQRTQSGERIEKILADLDLKTLQSRFLVS